MTRVDFIADNLGTLIAENLELRARAAVLKGTLEQIEAGLAFIAADDCEEATMARRLHQIAVASLAKGGA